MQQIKFLTFKKTLLVAVALAILLLLAEFLVEFHPYFAFQEVTMFYGILAFAVYCFYIIFLKFWRLFVKRDKPYYKQD